MLSDTTNACESLIWGNKKNSKFVTCSFRKRVIEIAKNLGLPQKNNKGANWLMAVMALETEGTFDPSIKNKDGYVGLIQFGESTAKDMDTTQKQLQKMTALKQLDYVEKHISRKKDKIKTLTDVYLSVLNPKSTGLGSNEKAVLWDHNRNAYFNNPAFHKEEGEWETIKKEIKGKKRRGFINGKTYIWEVKMVVEGWYSRGVAKKNTCKKDASTCEFGSNSGNSKDGKTVPWMDVALKEAKDAKGVFENQAPLTTMIKKYHNYCNLFDNPKTPKIEDLEESWCSSFVSWFLDQTDYKGVRHAGSRFYIADDPMWNGANNKRKLKAKDMLIKVSEPLYGAIAVFSDCSKEGVAKKGGHVCFVYGTVKGSEKLAVLGGIKIVKLR